MTAYPPYSYRESIKSNVCDEYVNVYLQRPVAGLVTMLLYYVPVTPNQVTLFSTVCGIAGGILLGWYPPKYVLCAVLFYLKDIFDSADGQLARAKHASSRRGRFWDSLGDFAVHIFLFGGLFFFLIQSGEQAATSVCIVAAGFVSVNLRVSYNVFYQTAYLHLVEKYATNRLDESIREEDASEDLLTQRLQKIFLFFYGWQDVLIQRIDRWSLGSVGSASSIRRAWYSDQVGLKITKLFGLGTEFVAVTICLFFGNVQLYLICTLGIFNGFWAVAVAYRKCIVSRKIKNQ